MSVDIILKDIEWDGVNKIRVPLEGGGTQDFSIGGGSANLQTKSKTYTPTTSQQTDTVSPDTGYDGLSSVNVTVNAMPSGTAGTPTATKGTVSNHSVSVTPSVTNTTGYITGGTKTGTSVSVSASELVSGSQTVAGNGTFDVTNLAQLIVDTPTMNLPSATSSTSTGTNKANILPSTSQQYLNIPAGLNETAQYYQLIGMELAPLNVTQNGTYNASTYDISGFNTVNVNVPTGGATLQTKSATYTPTESQQTDSILPDTGYDGMSQVDVTVNAISSSYVGSAITRRSSSDLTVSDATVTAPSGYYSASASTSVASGTVVPPASITEIGTVTVVTPTGHGSPRMRVTATSQAVPNVTQAGYISAGTSGQISVTLETNVTGKGTATFYPSTSDQSISASTYVSGVQTFKAVTTNNIIASNIKSGVTVEVGDADDSDRILSVTGTYTGGGGVGTLLNTTSLGSFSTSSTTATDTGKSLSVSGINSYDALIVETSVDTVTNNRHLCTVAVILLAATSNRNTKSGGTIATLKQNYKISSGGVTTVRTGTTAYGIYPNSITISNGTATIPMYIRYNGTSTGTINNTYTTRVYGLNLYDLIGG